MMSFGIFLERKKLCLPWVLAAILQNMQFFLNSVIIVVVSFYNFEKYFFKD
jgi:hypothetical protein